MQHITFLKLKKLLHNIPGGAVVKNLPASAGDTAELGLILGSGTSMEEGMATHSSVLAWRIPWTEEPDGLQSMGSQRVNMTEHRT